MLLIGSKALSYHRIPVVRKIGDIDVIGTQAELNDLQSGGYTPVAGRAFNITGSRQIVDFEVAEPGSSAEAYLQLHPAARAVRSVVLQTLFGRPIEIASMEVLYSLKRSHRHKPKAWHKHISDYHMLKGIVGEDVFAEITKKREAEYTIKTPSLKKSVADFFDDNVSNRVFIHDQIHEAMAIDGRPMYERIRKSPDTVDCSKAKWDALSVGDRIDCVREEAYVIALERAVIPMMFSGGRRVKPDLALNWAVMRICTTLCSGWFRDFATEYFPAVEAGLNLEYHKRFFEAVDSGRIKRIDVQGS